MLTKLKAKNNTKGLRRGGKTNSCLDTRNIRIKESTKIAT